MMPLRVLGGADALVRGRPPGRLVFFESSAASALNFGLAFAALDRLLDEASSGPFYLRQPCVADMIVEAIHYDANTLGQYTLHAFAVMPNHVHLPVTAFVALPKPTKSPKASRPSAPTRCWD
jgi:hypothetical protein